MSTIRTRVILATLLACALPSPVVAAPPGAPITIRELARIAIPEDAPRELELLAGTLSRMLLETYEIRLSVTRGLPPAGEPAILLGCALAVGSGVITAKELDAVKHDGYVVRGVGNRLAAAGYRPLGDTYAAYALLAQLGIKLYPWHLGPGPVRVFTPLPDARVAPFTRASRPFFEWRSVADHLDRGVWGGSFGDTGSPRSAANQEILGEKRKPGYTKYAGLGDDWVDGQHTAAYLVPRDLYYESHPEYFAMHGGKRIPPSPYMRMALCLTNPDVRRISTERALEWVGLQPEPRYFWVMDADTTMCTCPQCLQADYLPGWYSDRLLSWVNEVARAVGARHPDKVILTAGYTNSAKPPVQTKPEPNVRVICAPWYWAARGGPAQPFTSPRNITAMEELMGWNRRAPGQVGLYSYPQSSYLWLGAMVGNLKLCAKHNIRAQYFCGRAVVFGEYFHYLLDRLMWDPFLDSGELTEEFCRAFYGPAAPAMQQYFALDDAAALRTGDVFRDAEYAARAPALLKQAETLAQGDEEALLRVQDSVLGWLDASLPGACPSAKRPVSREAYDEFCARLQWYLRMNAHLRAAYTKLKNRWGADSRARAGTSLLAACGVKIEPLSTPDEADVLEQAKKHLSQFVREDAPAAPPPAERYASVSFDRPDAVEGWELDATAEGLAGPPAFATLQLPDGEGLSGGKVVLPLSRLRLASLPMRKEGVHQVHAGRFLLTAKLPRPLDASDCRYLELRLHASRAVPVTLYLDLGGSRQHVDFHLHPGEQIIRLDLGNFRTLDRSKWDGKLHALQIDFWPQDNFYPFPPAEDAAVVLALVAARSIAPTPADLPYRGKAIWLTQYRANLQHAHLVGEEYHRRTKQTGPSAERAVHRDGEGFRTFTEHRALSPIFAILTTPGPAQALEKEVALALQDALRRMFGVTLPIDPRGLTAGPGTGNVILLGRANALADGCITRDELHTVGIEGFVLRAHQGRIAIAGQGASGTAFGVARYLEDHGALFSDPGVREMIPALGDGYLHEIYLLDWPSFANRALPGGWRLGCRSPAKPQRSAGPWAGKGAGELAEAVKECAREGRPVPEALLAAAAPSPLARYVVARLLWDPFRDTSRLVREYQEGSGK